MSANIVIRCPVRHMAADKAPVERLSDNTERTWWLGTDVLPAQDQQTMREELRLAGLYIEDNNKTDPQGDANGEYLLSFAHGAGFGAVYNVPFVVGDEGNSTAAIALGYTEHFLAIMQEARRRGYAWVAFDRDIRTKLKQRTDPPRDEGGSLGITAIEESPLDEDGNPAMRGEASCPFCGRDIPVDNLPAECLAEECLKDRNMKALTIRFRSEDWYSATVVVPKEFDPTDEQAVKALIGDRDLDADGNFDISSGGIEVEEVVESPIN